jgi:ATP-dependent helicase/nuclease subunit B
MERMTERTMWALGEQLKKGDFYPAGFEVSFSAIDNLAAMKIRLSEEEEMHLRGRIDRLDLCEDETHVYVKIIDYKSGSTRFDLAAIYYGLQLQLVVYMDAVTELEKRRFPSKDVVPAGIFYYNIKDPVVDKEDVDVPEDIDALILEQLRMNGLVNSDLEVISHLDRDIRSKSDVIPVAMKDGMIQEKYSSVASGRHFEALKQYVRGKMRQDGREILDGNVPVAPYKQGSRTACDFCPYHGVCGFDLKVSGYRFRRFSSLKPEEIWEEILEGENEDEMDAKTAGSDKRQGM